MIYRFRFPKGKEPSQMRTLGSIGEKNMATVSTLEISIEDSGVFIYHFDDQGHFLADTWHETLGAAQEQAMFEFGIKPTEWVKQDE